MRITPECIRGIGKIFSRAPKGARSVVIPKISKSTKYIYAPEFSGKVSQKLLNKGEVLTKYCEENSFSLEQVQKQFTEAEQYLDEVSVERTIKAD